MQILECISCILALILHFILWSLNNTEIKAYVSVSLFFSKPCETNTGVTEATVELCVKSIWTPHYLKPTDYYIWLLEEVFLAMGRKKIQITRIVDERNRQVSMVFFFFSFLFYKNVCRLQLLCLSSSITHTGRASHTEELHHVYFCTKYLLSMSCLSLTLLCWISAQSRLLQHASAQRQTVCLMWWTANRGSLGNIWSEGLVQKIPDVLICGVWMLLRSQSNTEALLCLF